MTTVDKFGKEFKSEILRIVRLTAFGLHQKIVQDTPIDSGRAKSSWNLSQDAPDGSTTPPLKSQKHFVTGAIISNAASGASPLDSGQAMIAAQASQQNVGKDAKVIFISNGLEYIEDLEHGKSKQSPAGMVLKNTTQAQIQRFIDDAIAEKTPF